MKAAHRWTAIRPALPIMLGRTLGFIASFAIPMVLARSFDRLEFGTYRQLFLIFATAYGIAQLGIAESLYFFLPRHPARAGRWVGNALAVLALAGGVCVIVSVLAAPAVARGFRNPAIQTTLPLLTLFLALMLITTVLEIVMVSLKQHRLAAVTYAGSDIARALLLAVPAAVTGRVEALLAGAVVFGLLRCGVLIAYLRHTLPGQVRVNWTLLIVQGRYAIPFGAAVAIGVVQLNFHQYAVAAWFDPVTFAIYSVGCLQVPLVDILSTSVASVMMVTMGEQARLREPPLRLWYTTVAQLAFVFIPLSTLLVLSAREVIVVLFTPAYAASAPIFMVVAGSIALATLPVDAVLRVHAQTKFLLRMNIAQLAFVALTIAWFVSTWHLIGAALVAVIALVGAKAAAVHRIARLWHVPLRDILPWRELGGVVAAALLAVVPVEFMKARLAAPPALTAIAIGIVYSISYLSIIAVVRALRGADPAPQPHVPVA